MNKRIDIDNELERFLNEEEGDIRALYRRLPRQNPPRRLDRHVLNEAARAVHNTAPKRQRMWLLGVGYAAGIVLAAGIAWRVGHEQLSKDNTVNTPQKQERANEIIPVQPINLPPLPSPTQDRIEAESDTSLSTPAESASPVASPARQKMKRATEVPQSKKVATHETAPAAAQPSATGAGAKAPPSAFPSEQAHPEAEPLEKADSNHEEDLLMDSSAPDNGSRSSVGAFTAAPRSATTHSATLQQNATLTPDVWILHIRELLQQGRRDEAVENLRLLQRKYPQQPIPDDLHDLID